MKGEARMKRFDLGLWMFVGTFIGGLVAIMVYLGSVRFLYSYGFGNPPWVDDLIVAIGLVFFVFLMVSLVLMYGGDEK